MDDVRQPTQSLSQRRSGRNGVLILTRREIAALMRPGDYLEAVERAFAAAADAVQPSPIHVPAAEGRGGFHVKGAGFPAGALSGEGAYVAFKINGNFPDNPAQRGLPTIQGVIVLADRSTGAPLAVMDTIEVTLRRTAAATAVAALRLARPESATVTVCGCGDQARAQLRALVEVLPLKRGFAWDQDPACAAFLARDAAALGLDLAVAGDLAEATRRSDVILACTSSLEPYLTPAHAAPGAFIAAVGADHPEKSEIAPGLMARATVVADVLGQCLHMGDLHHAVAAGAMTAADVHADLAEVVRGEKPGRTSASEITLFDSTGSAIQDVASAALLYERAMRADVGTLVDLGGAP